MVARVSRAFPRRRRVTNDDDDDGDDDDDDYEYQCRGVTRRLTRAQTRARTRAPSVTSPSTTSSDEFDSSDESASSDAREDARAKTRASPSLRQTRGKSRFASTSTPTPTRPRRASASREEEAARERARARRFVAKGSKANATSRYDYRSRTKGVMGFEKFSDDEEDANSGDEDSWMVDDEDEDEDSDVDEDEDEDDDEDGDEDDDENAVGARHRRPKRTNPFESDDDEDDEKEAPTPTRRRLIRKIDLSDARDENATKTTKMLKDRSSARVQTQRVRKSREAAQHAELFMKSSLDDVIFRQEEEDRLSNDSASSATEDDDGFIVDDDENEDENDVVNVTPRKKRLSLGSDVDEALRSDDGSALIRALARLDDVPRPGRVLISAAAYNASSSVSMLLAKGMRIDGALEKRGDARVHVDDVSEALHAACERGHAEFVHAVRNCIGLAQFCRGGAAGGWSRNASGGTLVHSAANNETASAECVRAAIMAESSSDFDSKKEFPSWTTLDDDAQGGRTALMIAASAGDGWETCVAELVEDIKRYGPEKTRAVLQIQEPKNGYTAIHLAASSGAVESLQIFISECEATVHATDHELATPLHYASMVGKTEAVRLLLENGANRLAQDRSGWIPLLYANFHSERDAVIELLRSEVIYQIEKMMIAARDSGESEKTVSQVRAVFELLATIPQYYDSINICIARDHSTVFPMIEMLKASNIMSILDMNNRLEMARTNYRLPVARNCSFIRVNKDDLWRSLVQRYKSDTAMFLARDVTCSYDAYTAYGLGVTRDVFTSIAKELCDPDVEHAQLFEQDDAKTYVLKRGVDSLSRKMELVMFGEIMAHALLNRMNMLLPIPFSTLFMRRVLSSCEQDFSLDELENAYPQEVKSIRYVLECDDPESLSLSFADENGVLVDVMSTNRAGFVSSKRREMTQRIIDDDSASYIRDGLLHLLKPAALGMLSPEEFILVVCGSHDIDVDEWCRFADTSDFGEQLSWFWNIVRRMNTSEKSLLLQFSTGSALLPVGGFAKLSPRWSIRFSGYLPKGKLPTTQTCFNTMNCPKYSSEDMFEQRLMTAIRHGAGGFGYR